MAVFTQVDAVIVLGKAGRVVFAALLLQGDGQLQQIHHVVLVCEGFCALCCQVCALAMVKQRLDVLDAQIGIDIDLFQYRAVQAHLPLGIHIKINAQSRAQLAHVQTEGMAPVVGQHGDFVAREVHRRQALEHHFFHGTVGFNHGAGGGNVYAHAHDATI